MGAASRQDSGCSKYSSFRIGSARKKSPKAHGKPMIIVVR